MRHTQGRDYTVVWMPSFLIGPSWVFVVVSPSPFMPSLDYLNGSRGDFSEV